jgi:hypothetical protein
VGDVSTRNTVGRGRKDRTPAVPESPRFDGLTLLPPPQYRWRGPFDKVLWQELRAAVPATRHAIIKDRSAEMSRYVALRDRRLEGGVPARPGLLIVNTNVGHSLNSAFAEIKAASRWGRFHTLFIFCHGYAGYNERAQMSMDAGGMGLKLGSEDVSVSNVCMWSAIKDKVSNIVVYACAAADTQPGNEYTNADGHYLMGALAIHTKAVVYAADRIQWYNTYKSLACGRFDWGAWEGQLWQFPPNGSPPRIAVCPPVDFSHVMFGTAP